MLHSKKHIVRSTDIIKLVNRLSEMKESLKTILFHYPRCTAAYNIYLNKKSDVLRSEDQCIKLMIF